MTLESAHVLSITVTLHRQYDISRGVNHRLSPLFLLEIWDTIRDGCYGNHKFLLRDELQSEAAYETD